MKDWLALTAAILNGLGYCLYFVQARNKTSNPSIVSWFLWSFISGLDFLSYRDLSSDLILSSNFCVDLFGCFSILVYVAISKNFYFRMKFRDLVIFFLCIIATIVLHLCSNPIEANMIICLASLLSFLPIIEGVWEDRKNETPLSWWVQTVAYFFMLLGVLSSDWEKIELFAPAVLMVLHAVVAVLATPKNRKA